MAFMAVGLGISLTGSSGDVVQELPVVASEQAKAVEPPPPKDEPIVTPVPTEPKTGMSVDLLPIAEEEEEEKETSAPGPVPLAKKKKEEIPAPKKVEAVAKTEEKPTPPSVAQAKPTVAPAPAPKAKPKALPADPFGTRY